jgi:integrase
MFYKKDMRAKYSRIVSQKRQQELINAPPPKKNRAIILLLLDCGLRVSELIQLQCQHILFSENKIVITSSSKSREITMTQRLSKSIADY